jgi:hypothetical protein
LRPGYRSGFNRVDRTALRRAVLEGDALVPLIRSHPSHARVLLVQAVIEREVRARADWFGGPSLEITDAPHWLAPLPERGPFLGFLNLAPDEGLTAILEVLEHATTCWQRPHEDYPADSGFDVLLEGEPVMLVGDAEVMHWHRGDSRVPSVLASALMALEAWLYRRLDAGEEIADTLGRLMHSRSLAAWGLLTEIAAYRPQLLRGQLAPLITAANLLRADSLYRHQRHDYLLMPTMSERVWEERIRSWYTMEHRSRSVLESVLTDVLSGVGLTEELRAAREHWQALDADGLKHLLAQTDPANYRSVALAGGATGFLYHPPEALRQEVEESGRNAAEADFWLGMPYRFREWIDARRTFTDAELDELWTQTHMRLADAASNQGAVASLLEEGIRSVADLECGLAALLLSCAPQWLELHPDRAARCRERLLAPFADPPPRNEFDYPGDPSAERWHDFAADAIPLLWKGAPADLELRAAVVRLATHDHWNTVSRIFARADQIPELGEGLRQLEVVGLQFARYLAWRQERDHRLRFAEHEFSDTPSPDDLPDIETPTREMLDAFVTGALTPEVWRLRTFVAETPQGLGAYRRRSVRSNALRIIDPQYLLAAFAHLLRLPHDSETIDRKRRLGFAADLAEFLATAMAPDDDEREVDGTPYPFERTAFALLARMTLDATVEEGRPIWEPILEAGAPAHYWVEDFLDELWRAALSPEAAPEMFSDLIKQMLAFAKDAQNWRSDHGSVELRLAIVGLGRWNVGPIQARHAWLVEELQPEWGEWVKPLLRGSWSARSAVYLFGEPGGARIHEQALEWLAERERFPSDAELDQALAEMLVKLHARHDALFRGPGPAAENARFILSRLAARGNALALEMTSRLG